MRSSRFLSGLGTAILALAICTRATFADQQAAEATQHVSKDPGWYCGLYAVFGALRAEGVNISFDQLLKPQYVGATSGSTLAELQRAAQDHGAYAEPLGRMSPGVLRQLDCPAVLHVSARDKPGTYKHWVLFLGEENGRARIVESSGHSELYEYTDLLAIWDGAALLVSAKPIDLSTLRWQGAFWSAVPLLTTSALVLVISLFAPRRRMPTPNRWSRQRTSRLLSILACAGGLGTVHHLLAAENGLLTNRGASRTVVLGYRATSLPALELAAFREAVGQGRCVVVDARPRSSFQLGHIPGAVNVPIDSGPTARGEILAQVEKATPVVVYCQSKYCPYDESIAAALIADGFENVSLYPDGWVGWQAGDAVESTASNK